MTLVLITDEGLSELEYLRDQRVGAETRYYYVGRSAKVPVIVVSVGVMLASGQIWDTNVGNETGYPGFCRKEHKGMQIGKIRLLKLVDMRSVSEDTQVIPLGLQIQYFKDRFYPLKFGTNRLKL